MFPLKSVPISPHIENGAMAIKLRLCPKLIWSYIKGNIKERAKDIVSIVLAITGITITSGVCYMTLCQAHPIFAYEAIVASNSVQTPVKTFNTMQGQNKISLKSKTEILTKVQMEQNEYYRWKTHTDLKYKGQLVSYPANGVIHVKTTKWINNRPVKINIVEINKKANSKLEIKPKTANTTILNTKANIRAIASSENSIVAINGGYFKPQTGIPLGTLVIDKDVLTGPIYNRVALGINNDNSYSMDKSAINITIKGRKTEIKADNINQPRMLSTYTLIYTDKWGKFTPPAPKYGMAIAVKDGEVLNFGYGSVEIPKGGFAIVGPKQNIESLLGDVKIKMDIRFTESFENSKHIIGGGPYLVKNGEMFVDMMEQKFGAINGKNPRTAIGYTENDELIIVTVDGREETSVGMTLWETARLMKDLGCVYAMNLDGGGSSVIYVKGKIENTPAYKEGIAISNAIVVNETTGLQTIASN